MADRSQFAPCSTCGQYSHSIGEDRLADAFNHFKSMYSHRGDGIPTQWCFDDDTRDAAQVLMAAATLRDQVIEECAAVAEGWNGAARDGDTVHIAAALRNLKGTRP